MIQTLQPKVIADLTSAPRKVLQALACDDLPISKHQELIREAAEIGNKFSDVLLKFADGINHSNQVTHANLHVIGRCKILKVFADAIAM